MRLSISIRLVKSALPLLASTLFGCSSPLAPEQFRLYLADPAHGLAQSQEANGATVTCAYRPTELGVLQDFSTLAPNRQTAGARDSLQRLYANRTYCTLTFSRFHEEIENQFVTNAAAYQQALSYLNTGIATDAFLTVSPHDSVPALASMYVRQYGVTGRSTVLLVFNRPAAALAQGFHLTLRPQPLGLGTLRFDFRSQDLAAMPTLQLN